MHYEDAILPLLSFIAAFLAFLDSLKKGFNGYKIAVIILGLLIMGLSIYLEMSKSENIDTLISGNDSLNQKVETLSKQRKVDSIAIDNSDKITRRKIDSAKNSIADSVRIINNFTITILQKTIRDQSHMIDSLIKIHGEKELTESEKKNIIESILKFTKNANPRNITVFLNTFQNVNYGKFPSQLYKYLAGKGYNVVSANLMSSGMPIKGYHVHSSSTNGVPEIDIDIGSF